MKNIITAAHITKTYTIRHEQPRYNSLREDIMHTISNPLSLFSHNEKEKFYALNDVSFTVEEGEAIGIIGPNGAGKSTLLKILSRITPPTTGEIRLDGRVSSLLEVGTGFHPELTGRENIFLNGAILGMKGKEIKKKFDEIVSFAEIEKFLDTPVKHFSSGMYMRLAFAIAAHLEPEILIVDEVLAVGDAKFQKKCMKKMSEVGQQGRTVIFVSHNMTAINDLCKKTILLDHGEIVKIGETPQVIAEYLSKDAIQKRGLVDLTQQSLRKNSLKESAFSFKKLTLHNDRGEATSIIDRKESFSVEIECVLKRSVSDFIVGLTILSNGFYPIYAAQISSGEMNLQQGTKKIMLTLSINPNIFSPGIYTISLGANGAETTDWIPEALCFTIQESGDEKILQSVYDGLVVYPRNWKVTYEH